MSVRATMTMRATVERDSSPGATDWGTPAKLTLVEIGVVPCRAWSTSRRVATDSGKVAVVEDMRATVPAGANVLEDDRLVIRDRSGLLQFDGPVIVEARARKGGSGSRASHYELMLRRHNA